MTWFLKYITDTLYENNIISDEEVPLLKYGIEVFILSVAEVLSIIIVSVFAGNFAETLLYFVAFIPLRIFAGGYHADTRLRCYFVLMGVYIVFSAMIKYVPLTDYAMILAACPIYSGAMVLLFSPLKSHTKNRSESEKKRYRKVSIIIFAIQIILIAISWIKFGANCYILAFTLGQLSVALSMLAAMIKNLLTEGRE